MTTSKTSMRILRFPTRSWRNLRAHRNGLEVLRLASVLQRPGSCRGFCWVRWLGQAALHIGLFGGRLGDAARRANDGSADFADLLAQNFILLSMHQTRGFQR